MAAARQKSLEGPFVEFIDLPHDDGNWIPIDVYRSMGGGW